MAEKSFKKLIKHAPHKDVSKVNKYIVNSCFTCSVDDLVTFVNRVGYVFAAQQAREHIALLKEQFNSASAKFGDKFELDYFCDVGGTDFFSDFMLVYDKEFFYQEMIKFNPDFSFTGDLGKIKKKALTAMRYKELSHVGQGVSYIMGAVQSALKKIGVNPDEEIGGVSKLLISTMSLMDDVGGMQFYLPKGVELGRLVSDVDVYIDSYFMKTSELSLKYGLTYKSIHVVTRRVKAAMKEYEEGLRETN